MSEVDIRQEKTIYPSHGPDRKWSRTVFAVHVDGLFIVSAKGASEALDAAEDTLNEWLADVQAARAEWES